MNAQPAVFCETCHDSGLRRDVFPTGHDEHSHPYVICCRACDTGAERERLTLGAPALLAAAKSVIDWLDDDADDRMCLCGALDEDVRPCGTCRIGDLAEAVAMVEGTE